jgi:predicted alpha/beta-fold hydrolase
LPAGPRRRGMLLRPSRLGSLQFPGPTRVHMASASPFLPYAPTGRLRNGHLMTVYTWWRTRDFPRLPEAEARLFRIDADSQVLAHCHWQPEPARRPTLLLLHGLEASSDAHYIRGIADKGFRQGFNVVRLNQRNCGGTESLSPTLYHSGLTGDPVAVLRELVARDGLPSFCVAGYSLGGNLALKLAGEFGAEAPRELHAVCVVSPTMDLEGCVRALERPLNRIYQWNFMKDLKARLRRKAALFPDRFPLDRLDEVRTVREFDDAYTAPHFGFAGASDYYHRASALRVVDRIEVPTLVLTAADDPFVPPEPFRDPSVTSNPWITVRVSSHGGHCAFLAAPVDGEDGYWAEHAIVAFAKAHCRVGAASGVAAGDPER